MSRPAPLGRLAPASALVAFFRDSKRSLLAKIFCGLALVYVVIPIDLIPDLAPIIGWLDDIGMVTFAGAYVAYAVRKYRREMAAPEPSRDTPGR